MRAPRRHTQILAAGWVRGGLKSVQSGTITLAAVASNTATITEVDPANALIVLLGFETDAVNDTRDGLHRIALTNGTTVTATRGQAGATTAIVGFVVIEFYPGTIRLVQRGTIALAGVASNTATVTSVAAEKSTLHHLGIEATTATTHTQAWARVVQTDSATLTATKTDATNNTTVGYQLVQWW